MDLSEPERVLLDMWLERLGWTAFPEVGAELNLCPTGSSLSWTVWFTGGLKVDHSGLYLECAMWGGDFYGYTQHGYFDATCLFATGRHVSPEVLLTAGTRRPVDA